MDWSVKIAETVMRRFPRAGLYPWKPWSYPEGFLLWGFEELYKTTGDKRYEDYILQFADEFVDESGRIPLFAGDSLDDMLCGSVIALAYSKTGAPKYKTACRQVRRAFDAYPRNADGGFWHGADLPREMWVDGVFMGQMFLLKYGSLVEDAEYCFDEAVRQITLIYDRARKPGTGLIYHAYSEDRKAFWADPVTGLSPEVWCEGLGWYAVLLPHAAEALPENHAGRAAVLRQYTELLQSLKDCQDPATGLWYQIVDKGGRPDNWHDTSGSAMFAYSMMRAVELGVVGEGYAQAARLAYSGLTSKMKLNAGGLADIYDACEGLCVQKDYAAYINYPKTVNAQECVAACLMAAATAGRLEKEEAEAGENLAKFRVEQTKTIAERIDFSKPLRE